jgi:hypothetical protein
MDRRVRRAALRAAAKVSFGVVIIGCSSTGSVAPATPGVDTRPELSTEDTMATDTMTPDVSSPDARVDEIAVSDVEPRPDAPLACLDWVTSFTDAGVTPTAFDCCLKEVAAALPDGSAPDAAVITSDASLRNCCRAIVAAVEGDTTLYAKATPVRMACCDALAWPSSSMCTPWGPPVPPSMQWVPELEVA